MRLRVALVAGALAALACRKGSEQTSKEGEPRTKPSAASAPQGPATPSAQLLTVEDYEEEAAREINGDNLEAELTLLEEEIRKK